MDTLSKYMVIIFLFTLCGCATNRVTTDQVIEQYNRAGNFKALALSENGALGAWWGEVSIQAAINMAKSKCISVGGTNCKVVSVNGSKKRVSYITSTSKFKSYDDGYQKTRVFTCNEVSESTAYQLLYEGHSYLDRDNDGHPCEWGKTTSVRKTSYTPKYKSNCYWVRAHRRSNGSYVKGHRRCK